MACAVPCIASDVGDSAWLLDDARWIFPAGDVERLVERMHSFLALSLEDRRELGAKNQRRIMDHFTVEKMVENTARCIDTGAVTKILWITTGLGTGGAEMMLTQLISGLPNHAHTVISLTMGGKYVEPLRKAGATVHTLDMPAGKPTPQALWRLLQLARQIRPTIIMGWMYHGCLAALLTRVVTRARVIWNIRQSLYDLSLEKRGSALVIRALAWLSRFPQIITYNSQVSARQHEAIGYQARKTRLIPNGFDLEKWHPRGNGSKSAVPGLTGVNEPDGAFYIGRFGRYTAMKDYPTFLEAAALIAKDVPQVRFLLAGTGVDAANGELTGQISRLGLTKHVQLLGERHDLPALTASLDIVVSSSAFGEGFPNVVGEGMACGVPVVATDIGDTAWVMEEVGRLVPAKNPVALAQACLDLLHLSPEERHRIGLAGRSRIERCFSLKSVLSQFEHLLANAKAVPTEN